MEAKLPTGTLIEPGKVQVTTKDNNTELLVVNSACTHLGCIPIPYMGPYSGWICICHGSVYDRLARVRQGPAAENLKGVNNSLYGEILCLEDKKWPREPSQRFWA